ncbi:hypothetical protein [Haloarcula litorea]|nr:hypothetical protein [Halomicroarcula sp. GDY20]
MSRRDSSSHARLEEWASLLGDSIADERVETGDGFDWNAQSENN